ncbi:MAG: PorV/PorQ family protein [Ignavibacteriales bacterium]|nr:PorV/PorQ family protein [Ignavibacteriales bacterium]
MLTSRKENIAIKFLFLFLLSTALIAQSAGESGLTFLKFGFGARNVAMSDLGVVSAIDLSALNYNPSLIALNNKTQLSFTHNSLFQDLNSEMFGASFSAFGLPIAVGINTTTIANIEVRSKPGDVESIFSAHYFAGSISTAYEIINNFYAGATIKYLYESFFSDDANGLGFDFGISYKGLMNGLSLGAAFRNIGSMNELRSQSTKLPTDLRIGAAYNYSITNSRFDFTLLTGFQKYLEQTDSHLHIGGEVVYDKIFALRVGFASGYDSKSISAGFGVKWKGINLDYAFVPFKYGLGDSHIISFIYTFE